MISYHATRGVGSPLSSPQGGESDGYQHVIAQHYRERCNRTGQEREASPIIHLKKLHSWIKEVIIRMCAQKGNAVIDIACGKGADIAKWYRVEARLYVGVDIVESSLQQARKRYQELTITTNKNTASHPRQYTTSSTHHHSNHYGIRNNYIGGAGAFAATFICADCFAESLRGHVAAHVAIGGGFDVVSCQFALHYAWYSAARARATLASVAGLLRPGGFFIGTIPDADVILARLRRACHHSYQTAEFGNRLYRVKFDGAQHAKALRYAQEPYGLQYEFHLVDAVDHCPEWLVPFQELKNLAQQYGLELLLKKNFHEFVREHMQVPNLSELMRKLDAHGTISHEEWECVSIYLVFIFRKRA